jgi:hypothetical protein
LVLLDEVGGGTDPTEGAALGMALLQSFAERKPGGSLLTMATTHHGELKTLKYSDPRFENACVEFDEERLAPTFRLLWGIPGELIGAWRSPLDFVQVEVGTRVLWTSGLSTHVQVISIRATFCLLSSNVHTNSFELQDC